MRALILTVVAAVAVFAPTAYAQKKPAKPVAPPEEPEAIPELPEPTVGECVYQGPGLKKCALRDRKGVFEAKTTLGSTITVALPEAVDTVTQPNSKVWAIGWSKEPPSPVVSIRLKTKDLPDRTPIVVRTQTYSLTIVVRSSSLAEVDTQIEVVDIERGGRDAEIERRVAEQRAADEAGLKEKQAQIEQKAVARADALLLEDMARSDVEVRETGIKPTRNDAGTVLRTPRVVRVGQRRFLVFFVENRGEGPLKVVDVRVWLQLEGAETPVKATWKMATPDLDVADNVRGVIAIPLKVPSKGAKLKVRVETEDGKRSVERDGIGGL
jgi:hypothetical protein